MQVTRETIAAILDLALEGARGNAERQFVLGVATAYQEMWKAQDEEAVKQLQARNQAQIESQVKSRVSGLEEQVNVLEAQMLEMQAAKVQETLTPVVEFMQQAEVLDPALLSENGAGAHKKKA